MRRLALIKSSDPRAPQIREALKKAGQCTKITGLRETQGHYLGEGLRKQTGRERRGRRSWEKVGTIQVDKTTLQP
jgi:hypothetical protein